MTGINPVGPNLQNMQAPVGGVAPQAGGEQLPPELAQLATLLQQLLGGQKKPGNVAQQYLQRGQKKPGNVAQQYLQHSGAFVVRPLEKGVKVKPPDDSDYWAALGYTA